ncbi:LOW QUALITY PROTEIN: uncharacterized protein LOC132928907 [Rhopalosiphum padi]|uniref:LOW QUALITY PROTEIN: uncharacterized protein LOC132928907 n=1 Tax=Rhopalosiphum padi TaxID=40932 RepID=UPI00298E1E9E|nr:LOW QUALITY PROTEIN: uncharacterized protein LOC132928907 [Rhopalosiphum padi]
MIRISIRLEEYRMILTAIYQCEETKDLPIKFNVHLSKKSSNITEIRGNLTYTMPFDDSTVWDVNIASWSLTGGWKPNSIVYVTNNGCSKLRNILGNAWDYVSKGFQIPTANCPQPTGIFKSSGLDTTFIKDNNFPKMYFYGKYKYVGKLKNKNNKLLGCLVIEFNLVRPWESIL